MRQDADGLVLAIYIRLPASSGHHAISPLCRIFVFAVARDAHT